MKCFLALLAIAAGLTIAASSRFQRALFYRDVPATPDDWAPKCAIGGRYVTREAFDEWTERYAQMGAVPA